MIDSHKTNKRTVDHLKIQLKNSNVFAGELLAKFNDPDGYDDIREFNDSLVNAIDEVYAEYYGK